MLRAGKARLVTALVRELGVERYSVYQMLRLAIERSEQLGLYVRGNRRDALRNAHWLLAPSVAPVQSGGESTAHVMKKLRTLVVVHASLVPPESLEGFSDKQIDEWRTEYDVISTLRAMGHEVRVLGVLDSLTELRTAIADWKPDVVFNLLEEFDGIVTYDQHVVAFLELMRQPYTGCNPRGLLLSRDKALCKQLLSYHRIPTPQFAVFRRGVKLHVPRKLQLPAVREVDHRRTPRSASRRPRWSRTPHKLRERVAVRARAAQVRRAGRGVHRGPRAVCRRARQRAPDGACRSGR